MAASEPYIEARARGRRRPAGAAIIAAVAAALSAAPAFAEPARPSPPIPPEIVRMAASDPFSALVGKDRAVAAPRAAVERYAVASDGRAFLLEGRIGEARLQFLCGEGDPRIDCTLDPLGPAEEIYFAAGQRGPRGDVIFKDADGELLLRLMPYGGATVFWPGRGQGEAAARAFGEDEALNVPPANYLDATRRAARATQRLSAMTGGSIVFDVGASAQAIAARAAAAGAGLSPGSPPAPLPAPQPTSMTSGGLAARAVADPGGPAAPDAAVLADAVMRAAAGMAAVAADPTGARILGERIGAVRFLPGSPPRLGLEGRALTVVYDPEAGAGGRPSSRAVARFLEDSL